MTGLDLLLILAVLLVVAYQRWDARDQGRRAWRRERLFRWQREGRWGA